MLETNYDAYFPTRLKDYIVYSKFDVVPMTRTL